MLCKLKSAIPRHLILFLMGALLPALFPGNAQANAMEHIKEQIPNAEKVGEGRLHYLFWDIYDAELFAPQGKLQDGKPLALHLSYLRNITGKKIADRSLDEMRDQGIYDEATLASWHAQMLDIFPDVEKGKTLTGVYTAKGETVFYANGLEIGRISDPQFSAAFFDIWLNENTSSPDLRRKLLGAL